MKRILAIFLLICTVMSVTACERNTELPNVSNDLSNTSNDSSAPQGAQGETPSGSSDTPLPSSSANPNIPDGNSEFVDDPHEWEDENYIYNPNITDTTYERRYKGDFAWTNDAKTLWTGASGVQPREEYDPDAAVAFGREHWDDGLDLCAPFISRCLLAGGITEYTKSSTSITLQLLNSRLGFGQFLPYDKSDHTIPLPDYARPGDVVQIYCSYEGVMIHSLLMVEASQRGRLKAVCHNYRNNGEYEFRVDSLNDPCYDCDSATVEVFFYHFYRDDDTGLPEEVVNNKDILLWEEQGYYIQGDEFDRVAALEYAKEYPRDGVGSFGAEHTSAILRAGGATISYPNQSALFFQLLKSHLGSAYSLPINQDRTVYLPEFGTAGDICFVYCPEDGIMFSSFAVAGKDEYGRMIAHSYDLINDDTSAFKVESLCPGCGAEVGEVVLYHFDD